MDFSHETDLLYKALETPIGLAIGVDNFQAAASKLYQARRAAEDDALALLQIRRPPNGAEGELWIVKSRVQAPSEAYDFGEPPA